MYNLAVILFLVSLFNDQKVVPLNTELSLNGTSCPSNVTLRELKLGIIVAVARLSEGLSVTVTCADIPFPVTFMERRVMPFLSVSILWDTPLHLIGGGDFPVIGVLFIGRTEFGGRNRLVGGKFQKRTPIHNEIQRAA